MMAHPAGIEKIASTGSQQKRDLTVEFFLMKTLPDTKKIEPYELLAWLKNLTAEALVTLLEQAGGSGRLSLIEYIERDIHFPLIQSVFFCRAVPNWIDYAFAFDLERLKIWHVLLYLVETGLPCYRLRFDKREEILQNIRAEMKCDDVMDALLQYKQKYDPEFVAVETEGNVNVV